MNLSWFNTTPNSNPNDLIQSYSTLTLDYAVSSLTAYQDIWVTNNGSESGKDTLVDFGFYFTSDNIQSFNDLLKLASQTDGSGNLCGLFLIFGYWNDEGTYLSYIDNFNTLAPSEQAKFQINWTQGTNALNKISLKNALTYSSGGGVPVLRNNLGLNEGSLSSSNEGKGILKIRVFLRGVAGGNSLLSSVELNAYCLSEI